MSTRGRPKSDEKRGQILMAAVELFTKQGYDATNLKMVADAADVSKQTIYSHFSGKNDLLKECILRRCREAMITGEGLDYSLPPNLFLSAFAERFVTALCEPGPLRMNRLCMTEGERHPEVGEAFYQSGPRPVMQAIADYLRVASRRGELAIAKPDLAAAQFLFMLKGIAVDTYLLNLPEWPYSFSRQEYMDESCAMFLRAHQVL